MLVTTRALAPRMGVWLASRRGSVARGASASRGFGVTAADGSERVAGVSLAAGAGAGLVADSDPKSERAETEAKISALSKALTGRSMAGNP